MLQVMQSVDIKDRAGMINLIRKQLEFPASVLSSLRLNRLDNDGDDSAFGEHYRFDMSGYDFDAVGSVTIHNQTILNKFASWGIYDYHRFIALDFYKGDCILFTIDFYSDLTMEYNFTGLGTCEIIYEILLLTVYSGKQKRRRD